MLFGGEGGYNSFDKNFTNKTFSIEMEHDNWKYLIECMSCYAVR
jgi:hypothetical protein